MRKILLVRTDRIGDVVLITPAIEALKKTFPKISISVLVSGYTKDLLRDNPYIDEIITVKPFFKLLKEIKQKNFDVCILFFVDFKAAVLSFLAGIPKRIGPASKIWSVFLNKMISQRRSKINKHEADFNIDLLKSLGVKNASAKVFIRTTVAQRRKAEDFLLKNYDIAKEDALICIHPGSKGSAKNWPSEHYAKLADEIHNKYPNIKILLTGNKSEQLLMEKVKSLTKSKVYILSQNLTLYDFIGIINRCKIMLTNSTGPLHIAAALGKKTLSFFPSLKGCLPSRWGPYGKGHIVLMAHSKECPKCHLDCKSYNCMKLITVEKALSAFCKIMENYENNSPD